MEQQQKTFRAITVVKFGELKVIEKPIPTPGTNQVLVKMQYAPINPSDILNKEGYYPSGQTPPFVPGFEGSGIIEQVGSDCIIPHKVGDKVSVLGNGTWGEYLVVPSTFAVPILEGNTLEEAASHYINPATVLTMIEHEVIPGGHKAVIHTAGSSALGKMLIKELKNHGIISINIVRRDDYIPELKAIGADYVLNSTSPGFEEELTKIAKETSATLCFDAVGGELTSKILSAMPEKSHVLVYGALEGPLVNKISVGDLLFKKKVLRGYWITATVSEYDGQRMFKLLQKCQEGLKTSLKSNIQKIFKYEEINEALEYYTKNSSKGKILLSPQKYEILLVLLVVVVVWLFIHD